MAFQAAAYSYRCSSCQVGNNGRANNCSTPILANRKAREINTELKASNNTYFVEDDIDRIGISGDRG